jgi:hypothetical protein
MDFPSFVLGASAMGCLVIATFFLRFWRDTGDRFFAAFSLGFTVFAANRLILLVVGDNEEARTYVYLVRLLAFLLIIGAVVDKNRPQAD